MSMNLSLHEGPEDDSPEVDLWQTPTHITWMCLSYDPVTGEPDGGHEGVRRRYLEWVKSLSSGVWKDEDELEWMHKKIKDHTSVVRNVKTPYFSYV